MRFGVLLLGSGECIKRFLFSREPDGDNDKTKLAIYSQLAHETVTSRGAAVARRKQRNKLDQVKPTLPMN